MAFLNPVPTSKTAVACLLLLFGMSYDDDLRQAEPINETLAFVIVLPAVPLCRQFWPIRLVGFPICFALVTGSIVAVASAIVRPAAMGAGDGFLATIAPKSATAAVAVEAADRHGGVPGLTAVITISTLIFGAAFGPSLLAAGGVNDERAKGFALGPASHGIGTARAFQISETAGVFASIGMILKAMLTILLVPLLVAVL